MSKFKTGTRGYAARSTHHLKTKGSNVENMAFWGHLARHSQVPIYIITYFNHCAKFFLSQERNVEFTLLMSTRKYIILERFPSKIEEKNFKYPGLKVMKFSYQEKLYMGNSSFPHQAQSTG